MNRVESWKQEAKSVERNSGQIVNRKSEIVNSFEAFAKFLKETVTDESVPSGIPPALPWDDLAAKKKWKPAELKKGQAVRGKLNVPRERFRQDEDKLFAWAGKPSE